MQLRILVLPISKNGDPMYFVAGLHDDEGKCRSSALKLSQMSGEQATFECEIKRNERWECFAYYYNGRLLDKAEYYRLTNPIQEADLQDSGGSVIL